MNACIVIVNMFGNSLVMISVCKFEWLKSSTTYFVALLAFFDFCNGVPVFVSGVIASTIDNPMENITLNYIITCKAHMVFVSFSGFGDLLCILIITIDRYLYIIMPLRYHSIVTRNKALILSAMFLVVVSIFALSGITRTNVARPCRSITSANGHVFKFFLLPLLGLILISVIIMYGNIALVTWRARNADLQQSNSNSQSESQNKMTKVVSLVIGVFTMTYATYFITYLVTSGREGDYIIVIQAVAIWIWQVKDILTSDGEIRP